VTNENASVCCLPIGEIISYIGHDAKKIAAHNLANPAFSRRLGLCSAAVYFLTIIVRSIVQTSTEPIIANFTGLVELW